MKRLSQLPGVTQGILQDALPTLRRLLFGQRDVRPVRGLPYAARRFNVDWETRLRIEAGTRVEVRGHRLTVESGLRNPHDRVVVPVGSLPLVWHRALAQRVNGSVRKMLGVAEAISFLQRELGASPLPIAEVRARAKAKGIRLRDLMLARRGLGVVSFGVGSSRRGKVRFLRLPGPTDAGRMPVLRTRRKRADSTAPAPNPPWIRVYLPSKK